MNLGPWFNRKMIDQIEPSDREAEECLASAK